MLAVMLLTGMQTMAENWMKQLPDEAYVAMVSIPGAHNAATGCGWADGWADLGDQLARTQDLDLSQMWQLGVRAFDLRPCVYEDYMNINHGMVPTAMTFERALQTLCDSLRANPSEFIVVHLLHEQDGDQVSDVYNARIQQLLRKDDLKDFLVDFRADLKVGDMRGRMLVLSRDKYADAPVTGAFFDGWTGNIDWAKQIAARIIGPDKQATKMVVQDYSDTHESGGVSKKVQALKRLLEFSAKQNPKRAEDIRWFFNFASAYSLVESLFGFEVSSSNGYRDNATYTHGAIIDFLNKKSGPVGVVLMDFVGVDKSGDYEVRGKEALDLIIANNFKYLDNTSGLKTPPASAAHHASQLFTLNGTAVRSPERRGLYVVRGIDGQVRKVLR